MAKNFKKFFNSPSRQGKKPAHRPPEPEKQGPQEPPKGAVQHQSTQQHTRQIPQPQVPAADPEAQIYPRGRHAYHKDAVGQSREPGPQGAQKAIDQSQSRPQSQRRQKLLGGIRRSRHRKSRESQPPVRWGS